MAEPNKVDIPINVSPNTRGLDDTVKKLSLVERAGKATLTALRGLSRLNFTIAGIESVIGFLKNLGGNAAEAREEARKLAKEMDMATDARKVKELGEEYKRLTAAITDAAAARRAANEIEDMEKSGSRALEDDTAERDRLAAIAALDPTDPHYEKRKAQIEARFAGEKSVRTAKRAKEDAEIAERRAWDERSGKLSEADDLRASAKGDRDEAASRRRRAQAAAAESVSENEEDSHGFWSSFGWNIKKIVSGRWSEVGDNRTERGNRLRAEKDAEAKRLKAEAEEIEARASEKERKAAEADATAEHLAAKASAYGMRSANLTLAVGNAEDSAAAGRAAADRSLGDDEARRASALSAAPALAARVEAVKRRIADEQQRKAEAGAGVWRAQNALGVAQANGDRRGVVAAYGALQSAQDNASAVSQSADAAIAQLDKTLKDLKAKLDAVNSYLKQQTSQMRDAWTDGNASGGGL